MRKGQIMDEPTVIKSLLGLVATLSLLLFSKNHAVAKDAHTKIDHEREATDDKMDTVHEKINAAVSSIHSCRQEVDMSIHTMSKELMTEVQVKDFVDRSIKPIETKINDLNLKMTDSHKEVMAELKHIKRG